MSQTHLKFFAAKAATAPHVAEDGTEYVQGSERDGFLSVDLHVRSDAYIGHKVYETFATVSVGPDEYHAATMYFATNDIDRAVALRDAANAAIRHLRKLAKGA